MVISLRLFIVRAGRPGSWHAGMLFRSKAIREFSFQDLSNKKSHLALLVGMAFA